MLQFAVLGCKVKISESQSGHGRGENHGVLWGVEPIFSLLGEESVEDTWEERSLEAGGDPGDTFNGNPVRGAFNHVKCCQEVEEGSDEDWLVSLNT